MDEVAVIINPTVVANPRSQSLVTLPREASTAGLGLSLREVDRLDDGAIWLRYDVQRPDGG